MATKPVPHRTKPVMANTLVELLAAKLAWRQAKARILSVSYDEALRRTRQLLLKAQGYDVISTRLESTLEQCKLGGFDLFVLGHSIPEEDKQEMVEAFRQLPIRSGWTALLLPN
jgi:CheY-like chemotaxis protein